MWLALFETGRSKFHAKFHIFPVRRQLLRETVLKLGHLLSQGDSGKGCPNPDGDHARAGILAESLVTVARASCHPAFGRGRRQLSNRSHRQAVRRTTSIVVLPKLILPIPTNRLFLAPKPADPSVLETTCSEQDPANHFRSFAAAMPAPQYSASPRRHLLCRHNIPLPKP